MKRATKVSIEQDLRCYIRTFGNEQYILEEDEKIITRQILQNYSTVYCYSNINKFGRKVYSVNSARTHKQFAEVYVRSATPAQIVGAPLNENKLR